mmetsp:Transcript_28283/g.64698  ORF Transcript_28283/g.64698 Transcript_28283/m.64698 type:complete len:211 (+) Transcript_28283:82-714(+)
MLNPLKSCFDFLTSSSCNSSILDAAETTGDGGEPSLSVPQASQARNIFALSQVHTWQDHVDVRPSPMSSEEARTFGSIRISVSSSEDSISITITSRTAFPFFSPRRAVLVPPSASPSLSFIISMTSRQTTQVRASFRRRSAALNAASLGVIRDHAVGHDPPTPPKNRIAPFPRRRRASAARPPSPLPRPPSTFPPSKGNTARSTTSPCAR